MVGLDLGDSTSKVRICWQQELAIEGDWKFFSLGDLQKEVFICLFCLVFMWQWLLGSAYVGMHRAAACEKCMPPFMGCLGELAFPPSDYLGASKRNEIVISGTLQIILIYKTPVKNEK